MSAALATTLAWTLDPARCAAPSAALAQPRWPYRHRGERYLSLLLALLPAPLLALLLAPLLAPLLALLLALLLDLLLYLVLDFLLDRLPDLVVLPLLYLLLAPLFPPRAPPPPDAAGLSTRSKVDPAGGHLVEGRLSSLLFAIDVGLPSPKATWRTMIRSTKAAAPGDASGAAPCSDALADCPRRPPLAPFLPFLPFAPFAPFAPTTLTHPPTPPFALFGVGAHCGALPNSASGAPHGARRGGNRTAAVRRRLQSEGSFLGSTSYCCPSTSH